MSELQGTQYHCKNRRRLKEVADRTTLNAIDYLEVGPDQVHLQVYLVKRNVMPVLTQNQVVILGGVRIRASMLADAPDGSQVVLAGDLKVVSVSQSAEVLTVTVNQPGDYSTYTLRLVQSGADTRPPANFDSQLCEVDFTFKVDCPSGFDCAPSTECPPQVLPEPEINYLAKDYSSFRRLMLDRLSTIMPAWQERNPADVEVMLVELLAYIGDQLSYYQDAVATEAYLGTAHRRTSVRRHARLLDYIIHDGSNARAWVCFAVKPGAAPVTITMADWMLTRGEVDLPTLSPEALAGALNYPGIQVFMPMHSQELKEARNEIHFHTWSDNQCCLPRGATRATLVQNAGMDLKAGDVLVFEEVRSPTTGEKEDADPAHRHAVRLASATSGSDSVTTPATPVVEVSWGAEDALPFPLCLSALTAKNQQLVEVSVARGNVVLADHGRPITRADDQTLEAVAEGRTYRPRLKQGPLTQQGNVYDPGAKDFVPFNPQSSAVAAMQWDMRDVRPFIRLRINNRDWSPVRDLLNSDRFAAEFVVETEEDGSVSLRFGDDVLGLRPMPDQAPTASYRVGNGISGNVGAESISRVVLFSDPTRAGDITRVWNPQPATGGMEPESLEQVRQFAPQAFRVQERAVTLDDWGLVTQRQTGVQKAVARLRWTGSWYTTFVTIDRAGGKPVDARFRDQMLAALDRYRLAGYDLKITEPRYVPLQLKLRVCVKPGYFKSNVRQALFKTFRSAGGFFDPDRFTFGQPLYLSQVYQAAMDVDGVQSVQVIELKRWGKAEAGEIAAGKITPGTFEVLRLDNDPNFPENGKLDFLMEGGL